MLHFRLFATSAACALLAACGGAAESPLDAPGFTSGTVDASSPTTLADSSASPPVASHDSGSGDSGTKLDAAVPDSASPPPADDDSGPDDDSAPPPPADPGIPCGTKKPCDPTTKVCCVGTDGSGDQTFECESANDCNNNGGLSLPCASAADCALAGSPAGTVCCVTEESGGSSAASVACAPASQCADTSTEAWMCDTSDTQCPPGETCTPSTQTIPPYSICVAP
ncbi:MAG: hypothetical protein ACLQVI_07030 [Polyangiaceae bacterium]